MKRFISCILLLAMLLSLFAGCATQEGNETDPAGESGDPNLASAVAYLKTVYKAPAEITAADYQRIAVVPVGATKYEVEWSVDVSEEYVKIGTVENGLITIDVNEESDKDVPYVLTATLTGTDGTVQTLSWNHIVPKAVGGDYAAIVDMAYALEKDQALDFEATLVGTVVAINTAWSDEYQNITVTIVVEGREDKPIQCYRLKGEGAEGLEVGDLITVTGTLKNYNGTIEFDSGCVLDAVEKGAGEVAEGPTDPMEILEAAYGLEAGQSLPYTSTLTGKIIRVDTAWSSKYENITVTIAVEGAENMPVQCFRLQGEGAEDLYKDDTITVTGVLKNYYGTVEFDAGCELVDVVPGPRVPVTFPEQPESLDEVFEDISEMKEMAYLPYNVTLTGVVTSIATPWSDSWQNISYYMVVPGYESQPIYVFRMVGKNYGAADIEVGDTVTVFGSIQNYEGKIELCAGCQLLELVKGEGPAPATPLTIAEAVALGQTYEHNNFTIDMYSVTGTITKISNTTYGNVYIQDAEGNQLYIYGLYSSDGSVRYDAMDPQPAVGDTITVSGVIGNYNGNSQLKNGWVTAHTPADDSDSGETGGDSGETGGDSGETGGTDEEETTLTDPVEIVKAAYALEKGASLEGTYTLTGVISSVDTAYSASYGNITVTIEVSGAEDMPIQCFRLKGTGVEAIAVGDTITVTGTLKNYNGTIEFDAGCTLDDYALVDPYTTPVRILAAAYALDAGDSLDGSYTLKGVISSVDTAYSSQYGNVTVTIVVDGMTSMPIQCFRLKGDGADLIDVGDTITVTGSIKNYNGTVEFNSGCTLDSYTLADDFVMPTDPAEIVDLLYTLEDGEKLPECTLTGVITSVDTAYSEQYGNVTVTIVVAGKTDMPVVCYRLKGDGADTIAVNDTITVTGVLTNYGGTYEFTSGCVLN